MKKLYLILSVVVLLLGSACSKDDEGVRPDPANTATINMLDEEHGATKLGTSPVRIDDAHNFYGPGCLLADVGPVAGLGNVYDPAAYEGMGDRIAVIPGHGYVMLDAETLLRFPSGRHAKEVHSVWYRVYVEDWIVREEKTVGAVVKYAPEKADSTGLPAWEEEVNIHYSQTHIELSKGEYEVLCNEGYVICEITRSDNGNPQLSITKGPEATSGRWTPIYLRRGDVYTCLRVWVWD